MTRTKPEDRIKPSDEATIDCRITAWLVSFKAYLEELKRCRIGTRTHADIASKLCGISQTVFFNFINSANAEQVRLAAALFDEAATLLEQRQSKSVEHNISQVCKSVRKRSDILHEVLARVSETNESLKRVKPR